MKKPRPWKVLEQETVFEHPLLELATRRLEAEQGPADRRDAIAIESSDWVNVVPLLDLDGEPHVVLVRQWRLARRTMTLEVPGGVVDPGEDPARTARRELLEETGYQCGRITPLGVVQPNPALFDNLCHVFLAEELVDRGRPEGDGEEEIEVVLRPLAHIAADIREGTIQHALVVAAFHFFDLHRRSRTVTGGEP